MTKWTKLILTFFAVFGSGVLTQAFPRPAVFQANGDQVKVMSFNIRFGTADDGPDHWNHRREMVLNLIDRHGADVVGLQEAMDFQIEQIADALDAYGIITAGRIDGVLGSENCTILYRRDRFFVADSGTFWFSDTPEVPGSKHWGNGLTRSCTWVRLIERKTARGLYVYNVHLDHQSQPSRVKSTEMLSRRVAQHIYQAPVIVLGDFNMWDDNPGMQYLLNEDAPVRLVDSWRKVHPDKPETRTFNAFKGLTEGARIDFILVDPAVTVLSAEIDRYNENGRYPSDHYPITATLKPW